MLRGFTDTVWVACPRCGRQATSRADGPAFRCTHCGHAHTGHDRPPTGRIAAWVRRKCGRCGYRIARAFRRNGPPPLRVNVVCPRCRAITPVNPCWHPVRSGEEATDPWFGYRLWLQVGVGRETLWAYGPEHLAWLEEYVGARLRERAPNRNASLASRLPAWMKRRGNRDAVRRAIGRLKRSVDD